jgi:AcrR family transcriptional regulator
VRLDSLLRTACDVIAERGLANTRTSDVASAAGVSQALIFYHFATKERLLAQAFAYAADRDLARLDAVLASGATPVDKLRRILRMHLPAGRSGLWALWIDGWAESLRSPEMERVSRRLHLRWKEALSTVISDGVDDGTLKCDDANAAAWRIAALVDGLAVQITVHDRIVSRKQVSDWIRVGAAREIGIDADRLV